MQPLTDHGLPTYLRQLLPVALFAATAAFGGNTLAVPATASAAQSVWDIEKYDDCMDLIDNFDDPSQRLAWTKRCCAESGGEWNDSLGKCQAPAGSGPGQGPGSLPLGAATPTLEVAPPPPPIRKGLITETLTPAPVNPD
jgi:hypothetical protein